MGETRECRRDLIGRDIVLNLVLLDQFAIEIQFSRRKRVSYRLLELRNALVVDQFGRGQLH